MIYNRHNCSTIWHQFVDKIVLNILNYTSKVDNWYHSIISSRWFVHNCIHFLQNCLYLSHCFHLRENIYNDNRQCTYYDQIGNDNTDNSFYLFSLTFFYLFQRLFQCYNNRTDQISKEKSKYKWCYNSQKSSNDINSCS